MHVQLWASPFHKLKQWTESILMRNWARAQHCKANWEGWEETHWENAVDARAHGAGRERDWGKGKGMGRGRKRALEELEGIDSNLVSKAESSDEEMEEGK